MYMRKGGGGSWGVVELKGLVWTAVVGHGHQGDDAGRCACPPLSCANLPIPQLHHLFPSVVSETNRAHNT